MSMTRKQKEKYLAMQAKIESLRAELARHRSVHTPPTSTNANNITEDAGSPFASLATGVNPDTESSETDPFKAINVTGRASSPKTSLSKGVKTDTACAETVSPIDASVTEGAIPPTAPLSQHVNPATVQAETGPQGQTNYVQLAAEGAVALQTTSTENTTDPAEVSPTTTPALPLGEIETGITNTPSDEVSVSTVPVDSPNKEGDDTALLEVLEDNQQLLQGMFSKFDGLSPSTLDGPPSRTPSPTLEELHSAMNS
jgi:hypothetical protein